MLWGQKGGGVMVESAGWAKQPRILSLWALLDLGRLDIVIVPDSSL